MGMSDKEALAYDYDGVMPDGYDVRRPLHVERPIYQIEDLNRDTLYEKPYSSVKQRIANFCSNVSLTKCLVQTVPVLNWLPSYSWKKHILSDVISGLTVAVMHIPQGMAYALLGGVPPIVGIYMAFFPVLVYFIFGTSKHVSMGTFAIVCLMTGKVVNAHTTVEIMQNGTARSLMDNPTHSFTNVQVAATVTFTVALIQLAMYLLRLGVVSTLLSDTLVNGFTCASAFHVVASQLKDLLGLPIQKRRGNFSFIFTLYDSVRALPDANTNAVIISAVAVLVIALNNEVLKPLMAKKTRIPFPIELMAVVIGTTVSYVMQLPTEYAVTVVGHIPTGMPTPSLPYFSLVPDILLDAFVITMVSYTITMSMALIFARRLMYEVDANQELLALGLSNTVGSFFSCMPVTASLSRSMIQQTVGGVTQLASIVSCAILLVVLLWVGPLFELLPRCVLASIIVVALKGMLLQCKSIVKYWKLSKWDAVVWIVTFFVTLLVQISVGLAAGVAVSCLSIFVQGYKPYTCLLGIVPNTDLYLDVKRYKGAQEINGVKIFHYSGGLSFASRTAFKQALVKKLDFNPAAILRRRAKLAQRGMETDGEMLIKCLVLDFSCLSFVDPAGVDFLRQLQAEYQQLDVPVYIVGCSGPVYEVIIKCDKAEKKQSKFMIFPTVHDAVLFAQSHVLNKKKS